MPGAVAVLPCVCVEKVGVEAVLEKVGVMLCVLLPVPELSIFISVGVLLGSESKGAPTGISQRCPGSPCGGLSLPDALPLGAALKFCSCDSSIVKEDASLLLLVEDSALLVSVLVFVAVSVLLHETKTKAAKAVTIKFFIVVFLYCISAVA